MSDPVRRLAQLCVHEELKEHFILPTIWSKSPTSDNFCPGGTLLDSETIVIEKVDGEWPIWAIDAGASVGDGPLRRSLWADYLDALAAAQKEKP